MIFDRNRLTIKKLDERKSKTSYNPMRRVTSIDLSEKSVIISGDDIMILDVGGTPWDPILPYPFSYIVTLDCGNNCIDKIYGCEDVLAINYVDSVNTSDGSCYYSPGCNNPFYLEYDSLADYNDGSCLTPIVFGCTDNTAFN